MALVAGCCADRRDRLAHRQDCVSPRPGFHSGQAEMLQSICRGRQGRCIDPDQGDFRPLMRTLELPETSLPVPAPDHEAPRGFGTESEPPHGVRSKEGIRRCLQVFTGLGSRFGIPSFDMAIGPWWLRLPSPTSVPMKSRAIPACCMPEAGMPLVSSWRYGRFGAWLARVTPGSATLPTVRHQMAVSQGSRVRPRPALRRSQPGCGDHDRRTSICLVATVGTGLIAYGESGKGPLANTGGAITAQAYAEEREHHSQRWQSWRGDRECRRRSARRARERHDRAGNHAHPWVASPESCIGRSSPAPCSPAGNAPRMSVRQAEPMAPQAPSVSY